MASTLAKPLVSFSPATPASRFLAFARTCSRAWRTSRTLRVRSIPPRPCPPSASEAKQHGDSNQGGRSQRSERDRPLVETGAYSTTTAAFHPDAPRGATDVPVDAGFIERVSEVDARFDADIVRPDVGVLEHDVVPPPRPSTPGKLVVPGEIFTAGGENANAPRWSSAPTVTVVVSASVLSAMVPSQIPTSASHSSTAG